MRRFTELLGVFLIYATLVSVFGLLPRPLDIPPDYSCIGCNIVLISLDTLRADHVGCYGYGRDTTPNIDRLCAKSFVFMDAASPMPTTDPTHASMLTGLYPYSHGVLDNKMKIRENATRIAEILREAGYRTLGVVSNYHMGRGNGMEKGFERYLDDFPEHWISAGETVDRVINLMNSETNRPFFLFVHVWDPHVPWQAPVEHDLFKPAECRKNMSSYDDSQTHPHPMRYARRTMPQSDIDRIVSLYDAEIHYADSHVGRLLKWLESMRLMNDTIVIITSDHGEMLQEKIRSHGYGFDHGHYLHDGNLRVPLILYHPKRGEGRINVSVQASPQDIAPTITRLLNLSDGRHGFHGEALLTPNGPGGTKELFVQRKPFYPGDSPDLEEYALRTGEWKYMIDLQGENQLYNLSADPGEKNNLVKQYPEVAVEMDKSISAYIEKTGKPEVRERRYRIR